jgi:hypothetical protein
MALTKIPSSLLDTTSGLSLSGDITLIDNDKAIFGTGSDLQIYSDGNNSIINEVSSTGSLLIQGSHTRIKTANGVETMAEFIANGAVTLYYDNSAKLATTNTGISVTGTVQATALSATSTYTSIIYGGSSALQLKSNTGEMFAQFTNNGAAALYYDTALKLATTSTGIDVTGNIVVSGTVDGRDIATDGTKLDTIETNADVTDATNVTAAGALMDSEITNLAQVKAFDSSDYATAAQGSTADSALQNIVEDTTPQLGGDLASNGNDILFADNDKATFGAGTDLQIYHDGTDNHIRSTTSNINIQCTGGGRINLGDQFGNTLLQVNDNSDVKLFYGQPTAEKLATTSTGIDVTGAVVATSFSDGTISGITFIDEDSFTTNSATRVPTQQSVKSYVDTQVAGVVDSAPAALDTLNELAAALGDDANFSTTTSTALGNRLRVDTAAQGLTGTQQANAITNLGITATKAELNYVDGVTSNIQTQLDGKQASGSYLTGNQTITLSGDVSGSGTTSIAVTIADDSHNHVISNVDGLQTALDAKLSSSSYTAADVLTKIKTVDGAGSGLDADLLDGISSASFLRSDADDTHSGTLTVTTALNIADSNTSLQEGGADTLRIQTGTGYIDIGSKNTSYAHFATDRGKFYFDSAVHFDGQIYNYVAGGTSDPYWRAGNDGAGSGLDADLLDGQQGSYYAPASTALTTSTSFGGDVSGTYNAIVIADDSHNHVISNVDGLQTALDGKTSLDHIRSLGVTAFTGGTDPNITTAQYISEMEGDGAFDSYSSVFKTSWLCW